MYVSIIKVAQKYYMSKNHLKKINKKECVK